MPLFQSLGEQFQAVIQAGSNGVDQRRDPRLDEIQKRAAAGGGERIPADGGFLVESEFVPQLIERMYSTGDILSRCSELPISKPNSNGVKFPQFNETSRKNGSRLGGVVATWADEAVVVAASLPRVLTSELRLRKLLAFIQLTGELVSDAAALETFTTAAFSQEMAFVIEEAIVNGLGVTGPLGILNSTALIQVSAGAATPGTIIGQSIADAVSRLWAPSRKSAIWLVNAALLPMLQSATISVGTAGSERLLYEYATAGESFDRLAGLPLMVSEHCPEAGSVGDILLADFSRYIVARKEAKSDVSIHVNFLSDQEVLRFVLRVDGQPLDQSPVVPLHGTISTSPFVAVAARQ